MGGVKVRWTLKVGLVENTRKTYGVHYTYICLFLVKTVIKSTWNARNMANDWIKHFKEEKLFMLLQSLQNDTL